MPIPIRTSSIRQADIDTPKETVLIDADHSNKVGQQYFEHWARKCLIKDHWRHVRHCSLRAMDTKRYQPATKFSGEAPNQCSQNSNSLSGTRFTRFTKLTRTKTGYEIVGPFLSPSASALLCASNLSLYLPIEQTPRRQFAAQIHFIKWWVFRLIIVVLRLTGHNLNPVSSWLC
jgi:hypothetical protein